MNFEPFQHLLERQEVGVYVHAQIRAFIICGQHYSIKEILNDYISFKKRSSSSKEVARLRRLLDSYENINGVERPCVESLNKELINH